MTLVSAAFSADPRASLIDSKQLVLFLIVPVAYRFATGDARRTLLIDRDVAAAPRAPRSASSSTASCTTTSSASGRRARSATT